MRTYRNQFPREFWPPRDLLVCLARKGWSDESWGNDACPSFGRWDEARQEYAVRLWVEAKDARLRETSGPRYLLVVDCVEVLATESTADIIAAIEAL